MKYYAYLRVSTGKQEKSGLGMEAQKKMCLEYAKRYGDHEVIFIEDAGVSGSVEYHNRTRLYEAVAKMKKGDVLLVAKRDRLGRDIRINLCIEHEIEKKKCKLISVSGDSNLTDDPASFIMRSTMDTLAAYERIMAGVRTKAALQIKKSRGERAGSIPYGYRLIPNSKRLEKDDYEQEVIRNVLELRKQGLTKKNICLELSRLQFKNRKNKDEWPINSISRILKNNEKTYM